MKQEDKDLLLKDLCARLPYDIKCKIEMWKGYDVCTIYNINSIGYVEIVEDSDTNGVNIERIKPYLFPLSSMTEEQWINAPSVNLTNFTFESFKCGCFTIASYTCDNDLHDLLEFINWLIENHFDVNGLIEKGLAIDATELNIY